MGSSSSLSASKFKRVIKLTLKNLADSRLQDGNTTKEDLESLVKQMQRRVNKVTKYEKKTQNKCSRNIENIKENLI